MFQQRIDMGINTISAQKQGIAFSVVFGTAVAGTQSENRRYEFILSAETAFHIRYWKLQYDHLQGKYSTDGIPGQLQFS